MRNLIIVVFSAIVFSVTFASGCYAEMRLADVNHGVWLHVDLDTNRVPAPRNWVRRKAILKRAIQ